MTTRFRTPQDTINQERVARRLEAEWDCFMHLPPDEWHGANYEASREHHGRNHPFMLVEIKCRTCSSFDYPDTLLCDLERYQKLMRMREKSGLPIRFVIEFSNKMIHWIDMNDVDADHPEYGGRDPREGSAHDMGMKIYVPISKMERIPPPKRSAR